MNWFIIIIIILVIFVLHRISHLKHSRHKFVLLVIILFLAFFVSSLYFVAKANNIDMTTLNGLSAGMQVYAGWLLNSFQNIKSIIGYATGMDWDPKNKSIISDNTIADDSQDIKIRIMNDTTKVINKVKANTPKLITNYR